jgi:hypothetical protein
MVKSLIGLHVMEQSGNLDSEIEDEALSYKEETK